ncbi:hypothetical protein HBI81_249400 [Parastagonospora nodorum]|nr:hypothetical protein HBI81_249400 [Parastagonospora nodorum]
MTAINNCSRGWVPRQLPGKRTATYLTDFAFCANFQRQGGINSHRAAASAGSTPVRTTITRHVADQWSQARASHHCNTSLHGEVFRVQDRGYRKDMSLSRRLQTLVLSLYAPYMRRLDTRQPAVYATTRLEQKV